MADQRELAWYLAEVRHYPPLTREREQKLARRWRDRRDRRAADQLICASLRHVIPIARRYQRSGEPLGDLIAEGNLALMHALDKFDPDRNIRFVTYASFWVRAYLTRYVRRCRSLVSSVIHEQAVLFSKISAERRRLASQVADHEERDRRVAKTLGIDLGTLHEIDHRFSARDRSLDAPSRLDGMSPERDMLVSTAPGPADEVMLAELEDMLREAVEEAELEPRERLIVEQRLMADPGSEASFAELGRQLDVTREWARQLERRAMKKVDDTLEPLRQLAAA
ncbi:MAG: sigma-70 family RNA polymerase sigma factor, partial [Myxococcales bacterium]|nr:sigma-70 family RNA polymerase sigma factor [Myxococcales bacterium]